MTLLLDGLDEVAEPHRDACVAAINAFKAESDVEIVVCSRLEDYERLEERLNVGTAVVIQPLTDEQIDAFLSQGGMELTAVRATFQMDSSLSELTKTPFFLNIMVVTYQGVSIANLKPFSTVEARRRHLLQSYICRTFRHRPLSSTAPYTQPQAHHWLHQLAIGMANNKQSILYIEGLQPTWLFSNNNNFHYLFSSLISALLMALLSILLNFEFGLGLLAGATSFILSLALLKERKKIVFVEEIAWNVTQWLRDAALLGGVSFVLGLLWGIAVNFVSRVYPTEYAFYLSDAFCEQFGLGIQWLLGRCWLPLPPPGPLLTFYGNPAINALSGLIIGLIFVLGPSVFALVQVRESSHISQPNQKVKSSQRNGLIIGFFFTPILWSLVFTLLAIGNMIHHASMQDIFAIFPRILPVGASIGAFIGFFRFGFVSVIQHYTLRYLLYRTNILPYPFSDKKLIAFLDAMAERMILRRVGGGWIFIHRSLLEYFAELTPEEIEDL